MIGQRRAKTAEYRPAPREQRAWTQGSYADDEAREVRAFDNLREDRSGKPRYGKPGGGAGRGGPKKGGGGKRQVPDDIGNRLTAPGGGARRKTRGPAPGFENPAEHRSWYVPEGVTTTSKIAPPRHIGRAGINPRPARGGGKPATGGRGASPYSYTEPGTGGIAARARVAGTRWPDRTARQQPRPRPWFTALQQAARLSRGTAFRRWSKQRSDLFRDPSDDRRAEHAWRIRASD